MLSRYALCALPYANWVLSTQLHKQTPWTIQEFPQKYYRDIGHGETTLQRT